MKYTLYKLHHKSGQVTWCVLERHSSKVLSTWDHGHEAESEKQRLEAEEQRL